MNRIIVFFTIIGAIAALLVVPEVRKIVHLDNGASSVEISSRGVPKAATQKGSKDYQETYYLRVYNCDDGCRAYVNEDLVIETGFGSDSGWLDITARVHSNGSKIKFQVINNEGAIAYGFQVRKGQSLIFIRECGKHHEFGCENNRKDFPIGIAREFEFNID